MNIKGLYSQAKHGNVGKVLSFLRKFSTFGQHHYTYFLNLLFALYYASLKPTGENQLISVLRIHADSVNVGIQFKGKDSVVKLSNDRLNLNELGNMKYARFFLIDGGTNPCGIVKNEEGKTPLHIAASKGHLEILLLLIYKVYIEETCKNKHRNITLYSQ